MANVINQTNYTGSVTITGTPTQGQTLTAANTLADADGMGPVSYQWQSSSDGSNWSDVSTGSSLTLTQALVGKQIKVVASYTDGHSTPESVTSAATVAVASANATPIVTQVNYDLRVSTTTTGNQGRIGSGEMVDGGYVVVWTSSDGSLSAEGQPITKIMAQRFDASGNSVGGETEVTRVGIGNSYCDLPDVAGLADGGFLVTWSVQGDSHIDGNESGSQGYWGSVTRQPERRLGMRLW